MSISGCKGGCWGCNVTLPLSMVEGIGVLEAGTAVLWGSIDLCFGDIKMWVILQVTIHTLITRFDPFHNCWLCEDWEGDHICGKGPRAVSQNTRHLPKHKTHRTQLLQKHRCLSKTHSSVKCETLHLPIPRWNCDIHIGSLRNILNCWIIWSLCVKCETVNEVTKGEKSDLDT